MLKIRTISKIRDFLSLAADELESTGDGDCEDIRDTLGQFNDVNECAETRSMIMEEVTRLSQDLDEDLFATGSRVICPHVCEESTDYDYVISAYQVDFDYLRRCLVSDGYQSFGSVPNDPGFETYRKKFGKSSLNVIHMTESMLLAFGTATELATRLELTNKHDRIALFESICGQYRVQWRSRHEPPF